MAGRHILGDAAFEIDPVLLRPQWRSLTVRVRHQENVIRVDADSIRARRIAIIRAYSHMFLRFWRDADPFPHASQPEPTYAWEERISANGIQIIDGTSTAFTLRTGDVIVLSTEGVAYAYEVEIGIALGAQRRAQRPPQLQDYVAL